MAFFITLLLPLFQLPSPPVIPSSEQSFILRFTVFLIGRDNLRQEKWGEKKWKKSIFSSEKDFSYLFLPEYFRPIDLFHYIECGISTKLCNFYIFISGFIKLASRSNRKMDIKEAIKSYTHNFLFKKIKTWNWSILISLLDVFEESISNCNHLLCDQ